MACDRPATEYPQQPPPSRASPERRGSSAMTSREGPGGQLQHLPKRCGFKVVEEQVADDDLRRRGLCLTQPGSGFGGFRADVPPERWKLASSRSPLGAGPREWLGCRAIARAGVRHLQEEMAVPAPNSTQELGLPDRREPRSARAMICGCLIHAFTRRESRRERRAAASCNRSIEQLRRHNT